MIYGIVYRDEDRQVNKEKLANLVPARLDGKPGSTFAEKNVAFGVSAVDIPTIDDGVSLAFSEDKKVVVAASGNIFDVYHKGVEGSSNDVAKKILTVYQTKGTSGFDQVNGQFAAAIWDSSLRRFFLVRDHLGFEPLFYYWDGHALIFCSHLKPLIHFDEINADINFRGIRNYLLFNYNPGLDTFIQRIRKVRAAHTLEFDGQDIRFKRYWQLSYGQQNGRKLEDYTEELLTLTKDAIRIRTQESDSDPGAFLSGGMDSSSVVGLLSGLTDRPVHTFSFRCPEKDVDESYFARVMAKHYKTNHNELPYTAEQLPNLLTMAEWMEEPLCDIGVELGSFIMGRAAHDKVKYILTGDGGDELYAGHPVYLADGMAEKFDKVPGPIRGAIKNVAQLLPDSQRKKSLLVKTRRFAYSYEFPANLLSNRWRIYYHDDELMALFKPEFHDTFGELDNYDDIAGLYADADGPDLLSRSLYGDYQTLVHFHVDRLRLTRASGVEARFPLHDYRLVEFSSTIPSHLKIKDGKVKYVQWKALQGILPDEIVFRKDKMGHNVPMKNWMRGTEIFRNLIDDVLSEDNLKKRGYFDSNFIRNMLELHMSRKKDYSHRLYALLVLELWLQKNLDNES
jgi:asparagine synthase (glutamine-hydrolysing)